MKNYLKADSYRLMTSPHLYIGITGIALLYLFCGYQAGIIEDVYSSYFFNMFFSTAIIVYAFCAVPFSSCFLEDSAYHFWYLEIQKGSLKKYVWSKVIICFFSAVLTMVLGILLFALLLRTQVPFINPKNAMLDTYRSIDKAGFVLYPKSILLYFMISAAINGLLGGIFALLSAYLSFYEKNRMFTISAPIIGFYFLSNFFTNTLHLPYITDVWVIFNSQNSMFGESWMDIGYAVLVAAIMVILTGKLIERKVEREVYEIKRKSDCHKHGAKYKKQND